MLLDLKMEGGAIRDAGGLLKLEKASKQMLPYSLWKEPALSTFLL